MLLAAAAAAPARAALVALGGGNASDALHALLASSPPPSEGVRCGADAGWTLARTLVAALLLVALSVVEAGGVAGFLLGGVLRDACAAKAMRGDVDVGVQAAAAGGFEPAALRLLAVLAALVRDHELASFMSMSAGAERRGPHVLHIVVVVRGLHVPVDVVDVVHYALMDGVPDLDVNNLLLRAGDSRMILKYTDEESGPSCRGLKAQDVRNKCERRQFSTCKESAAASDRVASRIAAGWRHVERHRAVLPSHQ